MNVSVNKIYFALIVGHFLMHLNIVSAELLSTNTPYKYWIELTPLQHEALQPLTKQWDSLPIKLQKNLLNAASHYPTLRPEQKLRFQNRLEKWSELTPEQRSKARQNYLAISKIPPERREVVRKLLTKGVTSKSVASSVASSMPTQ